MNNKEYFESKTGTGVLSTADAQGRVDAAIYARPHVMDDGSLAFIMANRLSHSNLESNPHAVYLFKEDGHGYRGTRLYLTKLREEQDTELLNSMRRRKYHPQQEETLKPLSLVFFKVDQQLPLVGS
jgi:pyridoxamine 5'-phosphate oxidase-like protein